MTTRRIYIDEIVEASPRRCRIEIVERKGLGHPDTICDLVMERISQELSKAYLESSAESYTTTATRVCWLPDKRSTVSAAGGYLSPCA